MKSLKKFLLFDAHTCPWWLAYSWDNKLRMLIHNPDSFIKPLLKPGNHAIDLGCGMGYFSIAMARYVGTNGRVYAVDIQDKMLKILHKRIKNYAFKEMITTILIGEERNKIRDKVQLILAFWMFHEVHEKKSFLEQWINKLKENGKFLLVEPKIHISRKRFDEEIVQCMNHGLKIIDHPRIKLSRSVLFEKLSN